MSNKIYPIGIQNFEKIRQDGYFYVDKTALRVSRRRCSGIWIIRSGWKMSPVVLTRAITKVYTSLNSI